jgi:tRNA(fMet)-specific endonuclease VapC
VFLLDTNACIRILNGSSPALVRRFRGHEPSEISLCSVVKAELLFGARKSARIAENLETLRLFFQPLPSLPFDDRAADHYGMIRTELEKLGTPIGANDLMIAAIARAHDAILVTHNVREFSRVANLQLEDWEA